MQAGPDARLYYVLREDFFVAADGRWLKNQNGALDGSVGDSMLDLNNKRM